MIQQNPFLTPAELHPPCSVLSVRARQHKIKHLMLLEQLNKALIISAVTFWLVQT